MTVTKPDSRFEGKIVKEEEGRWGGGGRTFFMCVCVWQRPGGE